MAYLRRIESDSKKGALIEIIADSSRLGRHPGCEIVLDNNAVSREHARLIRDQNDYHIEDLHSRNGTYVNDELITRRVKLKNGDAIRICDMRFLFFDEPGMLDSSQFNAMHLAGRATLSDESNPASDSYTIKSSIRMDNGKGLLPSGPVEMPRANAEIKLRALIDIGRNLGAQVDQVLPQLLNNLLRIFLQADCAYIILSDKQTKRLELKAFKHRDPKNRESYRISRTILEKVVFSKAAILSDDVVVSCPPDFNGIKPCLIAFSQ